MTRKKILRKTMAAALAMLCCRGLAFAGNAAGTSAFQFLQLGVGARPAAMGGTYAGVADDVNAIYWNPAGLAALENRELSMTHALWLEGITYSNLACAVPVRGGAVGAAFNFLNTGDIGKADNTGVRFAENYEMSDVMGIVSYARKRGGLSLGANLKYISSQLEEESAHSFAADIGALYGGFRPWGRKLGVGMSVQNVGTKAKYVSEEEPLPLMLRAGAGLELFEGLLIASDLNYVEEDINIHAGAEYARRLGSVVMAARAGYKSDTVSELGALSGLTAGLGIKWSKYQLDYAWNSFTDLGITHRLSIGIKFGAAAVKAEPPAAAPVIPAASVPADTDADGAGDDLDKCPGTAAGTPVDAAGCPPDTDADGVPDPADKCAGTPAGAAVDVAGCPKEIQDP